jgi:preprotein translocase subunit SecG
MEADLFDLVLVRLSESGYMSLFETAVETISGSAGSTLGFAAALVLLAGVFFAVAFFIVKLVIFYTF